MSPKNEKKLATAIQGNFFTELFAEAKNSEKFYIEGLKIEVAEQIGNLMTEQNVSQTELGKKLDVDRAYVSRVLKGNTNPTLETLGKIAFHLDAEWHLKLSKRQTEIVWGRDWSSPVVYQMPTEDELTLMALSG